MTEDVGLRDERRGTVHVTDCQLAGGGDVCRRIGLGERPRVGRQCGWVVHRSDIDGDRRKSDLAPPLPVLPPSLNVTVAIRLAAVGSSDAEPNARDCSKAFTAAAVALEPNEIAALV